jgi:acetoin utilization protein AcuB
VRPDDCIGTLRELMQEKGIRHVPVVDEEGILVGLVSERDVLRRAVGLEGDVPLSAPLLDHLASWRQVR